MSFCLKKAVCPKRTIQWLFESVVQAAVSPFPFDAPEDKSAAERGKESPVGSPRRPVEDVCETKAGTETDVEDEVVDVVGGVDEIGRRLKISRSQNFCEGRDCQRKNCPRASLTPLTFDNVSFEIFKFD